MGTATERATQVVVDVFSDSGIEIKHIQECDGKYHLFVEGNINKLNLTKALQKIHNGLDKDAKDLRLYFKKTTVVTTNITGHFLVCQGVPENLECVSLDSLMRGKVKKRIPGIIVYGPNQGTLNKQTVRVFSKIIMKDDRTHYVEIPVVENDRSLLKLDLGASHATFHKTQLKLLRKKRKDTPAPVRKSFRRSIIRPPSTKAAFLNGKTVSFNARKHVSKHS